MDRNERQLPVLCSIYRAPDARQNFLKSLQVVCSLREQIDLHFGKQFFDFLTVPWI